MDRQFAYVGALPQNTDILSSEKNALYGLGYLAQVTLGTGTCVNGLVGAQSTVPDLHISIGSGAIYALTTVDATAYGDLGTDANTIVKQGLLKAPVTLTLTAPGTAGYSQVYLVEATYSDTDGGATVEPYYNSTPPYTPFAGPAGAGTSNYTVRQGLCTITLKAGTAAPTGSQTTPSTDAGYVPLYTITLANGQTSITTAQIVVAAGAPFVPYNLNSLNFPATLSGNGYVKFPNGFTIQWGQVTTTNGTASVTFPIAFTTIYQVISTDDGASSWTSSNATFCGVASATVSGFTARSVNWNGTTITTTGSTAAQSWIAVGKI